jgi:hypothetical protein
VRWLAKRRPLFSSYNVASIVTGGFPAYARILHPVRNGNTEWIRWSEIAAKSSRTMHRLVQFHAINQPPVPGIGTPESGNLPAHLLRIACDTLAEHTGTPDRCLFGVWNGCGWLQESACEIVFTPIGTSDTPPAIVSDAPDPASLSPLAPAAVAKLPLVHLPQRDYFLFEGPLEAAMDFGWYIGGTHFVPQSPNLFWPDDHDWCAASEIDLFCTLIGGSNELVDRLVSDPRLEAWRVLPNDSVTWDSDRENL